jgi:hypothetical protein
VDDDFFEGLPDNLEEYFMAHVDAANEGLKITDRSLGQVPSPNNSLEYIAPRNLPLLGEIGMNAEEGGFYRLVFTRDLFHFPKSDDSRLPSRIYMIEGIIKKRAAESPSNPPGLVIKSDEMKTFMEPFKRAFSQTPGGKKAPKRSDLKRTFSQTCSDKKLPKTSDLAVEALVLFSESSGLWMDVYQRRLGINFKASRDWIKKAFINASIETSPLSRVENIMDQHFVAYIFLVDVIITILPQPTKDVVNRIQVFREAVSCFQSYTEKIIKSKTLNLKRIYSLWGYITYWLTQDRNYKSNSLLWSKSKIHYTWKVLVNFILAYSLVSLHERRDLALSQLNCIPQYHRQIAVS